MIKCASTVGKARQRKLVAEFVEEGVVRAGMHEQRQYLALVSAENNTEPSDAEYAYLDHAQALRQGMTMARKEPQERDRAGEGGSALRCGG